MLTRKMKDSGIEWIGEIPEDWEVIRNKYIFNKKNIKVGDKHSEYQLLSLTKKGIVEKDIEVSGGKLPASFSTYQAVETSDIVLCLFDIDVSAVFSGISKFEGMISSAYDVFSVNSKMSPDFYDYYFQLAGFNRSYIIYSKTLRKTINEDNFRSIFSIVPPLERQVKIARKLDQVVLKIENIINETQQSIEELKKYKQSLITETVTKGLDPNVEMKDSGIEWIGDIPKHWSMSRVKNEFTLSKGLTITKSDLKDKGIPVINYGEIHSRYGFRFDTKIHPVKNVDEEYLTKNKNSLIKKGDFIFADTSEDLDGSGNFTCYIGDTQCFAGSHTVILKPRTNINHLYFSYLFESLAFRVQIQEKVQGIKVFSITQGILKPLTLIIPTEEEQDQIVSYLDEQTSRIDKLIADKTKVIEELEDYKKSLIYEYVTGKKEV